jgi:hypothetical protein
MLNITFLYISAILYFRALDFKLCHSDCMPITANIIRDPLWKTNLKAILTISPLAVGGSFPDNTAIEYFAFFVAMTVIVGPIGPPSPGIVDLERKLTFGERILGAVVTKIHVLGLNLLIAGGLWLLWLCGVTPHFETLFPQGHFLTIGTSQSGDVVSDTVWVWAIVTLLLRTMMGLMEGVILALTGLVAGVVMLGWLAEIGTRLPQVGLGFAFAILANILLRHLRAALFSGRIFAL